MLLAVDTSTRMVGLALFNGTQVLSESVWQSQAHHTVEVAPAAAALLNTAGIKPGELRALAVALGPGSFTSLRIGLGLVKGMSLALHIPIVGVPTLDILAASQPVQDVAMAAVLEAGRGRLAVGWYRVERGSWRSRGEPQVMTADELAEKIENPTIVCGELNPEQRQALNRKRKNVILASPARSLRRPGYLAEMAWRRWQAGKVDDPVALAPLYLHIAEAIPA
jgi:tRNA threonylcarbamoyladenosine biosynthesis protein TsaB